MTRTSRHQYEDDDDSLDDYFAACRGHDAESMSSGSLTDASDGEDGGAISTWRATAGDSPLRGRAAQTSARRRLVMQQLRTARQDTPQRRMAHLHGAFPTEAKLAASRSEAAQGLAAHIQSTLSVVVEREADDACVRSPSAARYQSPSELASQAAATTTEAELRLLRDALCAVRQVETACFTHSAAGGVPTWGFRDDESVAASVKCAVSRSVVAVARQTLATADRVATLKHHLRYLAQLVAQHRQCAASVGERSRAATATTAMCRAAEAAIVRFHAFVERSLQFFMTWLMEVEACLVHLATGADPSGATKARRVDDAAVNDFTAPPTGAAALLGADLLSLPLVIEQNADTLLQCLAVCESLADVRTRHVVDGVEATVVATGRALVDTLITEASMAQDASRLNEFRLDVMLLLTCAWPYVRLAIDAFFGRLTDVDAAAWRVQFPLLFRTALSPAHGGVDVLSLILGCIDYPGATLAHPTRRGAADEAVMMEANAAAASSCRYVLRSLLSFAQRRRKGRSRIATDEAAGARDGKERTVDAILVELMTTGAAEEAGPSIGTFLSPLQHRRLLQALSAGASVRAGRVDATGAVDPVQAPHVMDLATSLPLGVRTMTAALDHVGPWRRPPADGERRDEEEDKLPGTAAHTAGSRSGILWRVTVVLEDEAEMANLCLRARDDSRSDGNDEWASAASTEVLPRRTKALWVDAAIPVTRWVVAALLVPLSLVAQRLQERRLAALCASRPPRALSRVTATALGASPREAQTEENADGSLSVRATHTSTSYALHGLTGKLGAHARLAAVPSDFSLYSAVKLLVDVALCRDTERVVRRFLERLDEEPHWWFRRADGARDGTASTFISNTFADALRDKRYGALVTLAVLPAAAAATHGPEPAETTAREGDAADSPLDTPLDIFSCFQLHFAFPEALAVVLLPRVLSLYMLNETGTLERHLTDAFWQHRRGRAASGDVSELRLQSAVHQLGASRVKSNGPHSSASGVAMCDVWSYAFGYLCSLQYAQMTLRRRQKQVRQQEVDDHQLLASLGRHTAASQRLQRISRGLGSVFFTLSFAVDTLLTFAQREVTIFIHSLEHTLQRGSDRTAGSAMGLCQEVDALLLELFLVCFPARAPESHSEKERLAVSATSEAVREAISRVVRHALNPTHAPPSTMNSRVNAAVDALVITIQSLRDATVLKSRLHPLVTLFTFNRFYGVNQETGLYQFR